MTVKPKSIHSCGGGGTWTCTVMDDPRYSPRVWSIVKSLLPDPARLPAAETKGPPPSRLYAPLTKQRTRPFATSAARFESWTGTLKVIWSAAREAAGAARIVAPPSARASRTSRPCLIVVSSASRASAIPHERDRRRRHRLGERGHRRRRLLRRASVAHERDGGGRHGLGERGHRRPWPLRRASIPRERDAGGRHRLGERGRRAAGPRRRGRRLEAHALPCELLAPRQHADHGGARDACRHRDADPVGLRLARP